MYHERDPKKQQPRTVTVDESDLLAVSTLLTQASQLFATMARRPEAASPEVGAGKKVDTRAAVELAVKMRDARQRRRAHLSPALFGEPGWDMLLSLYISQFDGPRLSVGRLSSLSGAPPTTALRWLDYLERERLISREPNPTDARSAFVDLTDKGRTIMDRYLSDTVDRWA